MAGKHSTGARLRTALWVLWTVLTCAGCDDGETTDRMIDAKVADPCDDGHSHSHSHSHSHGDACGDAGTSARLDGGVFLPDAALAYAWKLPKDVAPPRVPEENPMSEAKVELGRHLFYDTRLSGNGTQSCASCHKQELAFADERAVGFGSTGVSHTRGSMSLVNVAYSPTLTWANPVMTTLERQLHVPLFGDDPVELGMPSMEELERRLRAEPRYAELFPLAFPGDADPITMLNVERALASFERAIVSFDSPFDRYYYGGDESALSESAKRGMVFVTSNEDHRFECNHCHGGLTFSDHFADVTTPLDERLMYHQTGLYNIDGRGGYPAPNTGVHEVTGNPRDMGKFKAPTLRNVAVTAPYMHDGSIATLSEVIDHYAKGGRAHLRGATDSLLEPFTITEQEKADIIAFLESLTDTTVMTDPKLANPWASEPASAAKPQQ